MRSSTHILFMKNKTLSTWLSLLGGPLGLHRFYLFGLGDTLGWALPIPTALGLYGLMRARSLGQDDPLSWMLMPLVGFVIAGCALNAIVYGLMSCERWNARFNGTAQDAAEQPSAGQTRWLTVMAVVASLLVGTTALMASLAYSFQRYFEWQVELARQISQ
jgi:hypothetical protein